MKKSTKQVLVLLLILVICAGTYFGVVIYKAAQASRFSGLEASAAIYIGDLDDVSHITLYNGTETLSFCKEGSGWYYEDDTDFPLDATHLRSIASAAVGLTAVREIPITEDLSAYGLGEDSRWVELTASDGKSLKLLIGNYVNYNYYAMEPDGDVIYQIDYKIPENLDDSLKDLLVLESFDTPDEAIFETMSFLTGEDSVEIMAETYDSDGTVEVMDQETGERKTETVSAGRYWYVIVNGEKYNAMDFKVPGPDSGTDDGSSPALIYISYLMEYLSELSIDSNYAYKPSAELLTECGLDVPDMTISFAYQFLGAGGEWEECAYVFHVGAAMENGEKTFRYVRFDGSDQLNLMEEALLTPVCEVVGKLLSARTGDMAGRG